MTKYIAISNRRGGVGKTTTTMMLAYGLSVFGFQRVLVIDLDAQASTSTVLMGHDRWRLACQNDQALSSLLLEIWGEGSPDLSRYISQYVGDVQMNNRKRPAIDCIPASFDLDRSELEMLFFMQGAAPTLDEVFAKLRGRVAELIRSVPGHYDYVLLDCPPGLSQVAWGALEAADYVIVPYLPDATAEYNIQTLIERIHEFDPEKKIRVLANQVRPASAFQRALISRLGQNYRSLGIEMPRRASLSNALEYRAQAIPLRSKFGDGSADVERLFAAVTNWVGNAGQPWPRGEVA